MPYTSIYLGILETIMQWATNLLSTVISFVIDLLTSIFAGLLYKIGAMLLGLVDFVQSLFRKLAGLEKSWYAGAENEGDFLLQFLSEDSVLKVFLGMTLVAIAILLITTIVQIIRTEYTTTGAENTKAKIFGKTLKGLVYFVAVPVACFFGIYVSNFLLQALDRASNPSGSSKIGGAVFLAAMSQANRFTNQPGSTQTILGAQERQPWTSWLTPSDNEETLGQYRLMYTNGEKPFQNSNTKKTLDEVANKLKASINIPEGSQNSVEAARYYGGIVDLAFASGVSFSDQSWSSIIDNDGLKGGYSDKHVSSASQNVFDYTDQTQVDAFYSIKDTNFLILFGGSMFATYCMLMACFGLMIRIIKGMILFMIAPPIVGMFPIDESAFGNWRKRFVGAVLSAYGTVVSLNLLFVILPLLKNIQLFDPSGKGLAGTANIGYNNLIYLLFVIVCLFFFKDAPSLLGGLIGADDAMGEGTKMAKNVGGTIGKGVNVAKNVGGMVAHRGAQAANWAHSRSLSSQMERAGSDEEKEVLKAKMDKADSRRAAHRTAAISNADNVRSTASGGLNTMLGGGLYKPKDAKTRQADRDKRVATLTSKAQENFAIQKAEVEVARKKSDAGTPLSNKESRILSDDQSGKLGERGGLSSVRGFIPGAGRQASHNLAKAYGDQQKADKLDTAMTSFRGDFGSGNASAADTEQLNKIKTSLSSITDGLKTKGTDGTQKELLRRQQIIDTFDKAKNDVIKKYEQLLADIPADKRKDKAVEKMVTERNNLLKALDDERDKFLAGTATP